MTRYWVATEIPTLQVIHWWLVTRDDTIVCLSMFDSSNSNGIGFWQFSPFGFLSKICEHHKLSCRSFGPPKTLAAKVAICHWPPKGTGKSFAGGPLQFGDWMSGTSSTSGDGRLGREDWGTSPKRTWKFYPGELLYFDFIQIQLLFWNPGQIWDAGILESFLEPHS